MQMQTVSKQPTMSSREIAELTGKEHANVMRDIRIMLEGLQIDPLSFEAMYLDAYQREQACFELPKNLTMTLVSGYSVQLRHKIVTRLEQLEAKPAPSDLTRMDILKLALESEQGRMEAEAKLAIAAPKVEFFDKVVQRKTLMTSTQIAQKLGMSAIKLNKHLDELGIYALGVKRARVFKQWVIDKGLGELKQTELGFSQPLFTTAGEAWIVERLTSEGVA